MLESGFYNMDCMQAMRDFPDKFFDLAIVDPPYGGGSEEYDATTQRYGGRFDKYFEKNIKVERTGGTGGGWRNDRYGKNIARWDVAPPAEYFEELFRVSKNQIIWGGNYFELPATRCFIVWEKINIPPGFTMAMCEYAWTSFNQNAKICRFSSARKENSGKFHPTEKPIELYAWILNNYAEKDFKILDTHVGSASSLIACHNARLPYWGFEIDKSYYEKAKKRLDAETAQMSIFDCFEQLEIMGGK